MLNAPFCEVNHFLIIPISKFLSNFFYSYYLEFQFFINCLLYKINSASANNCLAFTFLRINSHEFSVILNCFLFQSFLKLLIEILNIIFRYF